MADKKISQKEYLKKYLSNDPSRKKKKKKEKSFGKPTLVVIIRFCQFLFDTPGMYTYMRVKIWVCLI